MSDDDTERTHPTNRLREAQKQAALAREELDRDSPEWEYAQKTLGGRKA